MKVIDMKILEFVNYIYVKPLYVVGHDIKIEKIEIRNYHNPQSVLGYVSLMSNRTFTTKEEANSFIEDLKDTQ